MANRSDNFNRADNASSLGTPSDGGSAWVAQSGTWGVSSNQAYHPVQAGHDTATLDAAVADATVQVTFSSLPAGADSGFCFRLSDGSNYFVQTILGSSNGGGGSLFKLVAGSFTQLGSFGTQVVNGDVCKAVLSGTSVITYLNGVQKISVTDSFNQTATKHGLRAHDSIGTLWDDFAITDPNAGGGGGIVYTQLERSVRGLNRGSYFFQG